MRVSLYLLLILLMACQPSDPSAAYPLFYKTWERQSGTFQGNSQPDFFNEPLVTFRPDGDVLYGEQLNPGGCCRPTHFTLTSDTLQFSGKGCPGVRCSFHELYTAGPWQILTLNSTTLIIRKPDQHISYRAR